MCHVKVDAEKIPCFAFISPMGFSCFVQAYEVVYTYGQTKFKAQLRWEEEVFDQFFYADATIVLIIISGHRAKRKGAFISRSMTLGTLISLQERRGDRLR